MNAHRLARLKRLAAGAALVSSTLVSAGEPPAKAPSKPNVNSPPQPEPKPEPIYVNSPKPADPVDAGTPTPVVEQPKPKPQPPTVNSPPRPMKK